MKLISFIALFALSITSVAATGHGGKVPHQGDLTLADLQAMLDTEAMMMASTSEDEGTDQLSRCSSSATPRATTGDEEGIIDPSEAGLPNLTDLEFCILGGCDNPVCRNCCKIINYKCYNFCTRNPACSSCWCRRGPKP